jgi:histidine ammonia-lyase
MPSSERRDGVTSTILIDGNSLTLADVRAVAYDEASVAVAPSARAPIDATGARLTA